MEGEEKCGLRRGGKERVGGGKERGRREGESGRREGEREEGRREGGGKECLHIPPVLYQTSYHGCSGGRGKRNSPWYPSEYYQHTPSCPIPLVPRLLLRPSQTSFAWSGHQQPPRSPRLAGSGHSTCTWH